MDTEKSVAKNKNVKDWFDSNLEKSENLSIS